MTTFAALILLTVLSTNEGNVAQPSVLADAVERREFHRVVPLLSRGAAVDVTQADGMTALHWAVHHEHVKTLEALLDARAKVDVENRYGVRPLSIACENASAEVIRRLLVAGADANAEMAGGETALMTASRSGSVGSVKLLVDHGARLDAKERRGQTALMWAAAEGHAGVVRLLLERGAERDIRLGSGFTAFLFAVREGQLDVVRAFLENGVDVHEALAPGKATGSGVWKKAGAKETSALLLAVENAHFELALELLKAGADPNDERAGFTALHAMSWVRKTERGDGANGNPPPEGSGRVGSLAFVKQLVDRGADVNHRLRSGRGGAALVGRKGSTPFLLASKNADLPLMRALLALGADPGLANAEGCTPLLAAAGMGVRAPGEEPGTEAESLEAMRLLLELGADVNAVDASGETAMHCAAYKSAPRIVKFLAERGAKIDVWNRKNKHGWTPLVIAQGFRPGNFKPSTETIAAIEAVMRAEGVEPPPPPPRRP